MGTVYKKTVTRPLPKWAELFTKNGQPFARWKPAKGKTRTAKEKTGEDGSPRILDEAGTYVAKLRDGEGLVREVSTGCRETPSSASTSPPAPPPRERWSPSALGTKPEST